MLKEHNLRMTRQRQVILETLQEHNIHPTADEVYELVRKKIPRISLGTVYRNLEVLSELGKILKLEFAGSQKRFDGIAENHYHIRCMRCDRVDDAPCGLIADLENRLAAGSGYKVMGYRLEFVGLCARCQEHISITDKEKALLL